MAKPRTSTAGDTGFDPYTTAQKDLKWTSKDTAQSNGRIPVVRIKFADGADWQHKVVKDNMEAWRSVGANIDFDFVPASSRSSEILVSFSGGVNQSSTGTKSRSRARSGTPSMYLPGVRKERSSDLWRRLVLHEFGHGLMAFGHEHRHADANYKFKDNKYIMNSLNKMENGKNWTETMVKTNITDPPYSSNRTCTKYDTKSIMHYPVMSDWLVDGVAVPYPATRLSSRDTECAKLLYA